MKTKFLACLLLAALSGGSFAQDANTIEIESWVTKPDRSMLFEKMNDKVFFSDNGRGRGLPIVIDESHTMQTIDGFGFALTGGSAGLMMKMSPEARKALIEDLFSRKDNHIGVSYIRLTIGASDMNSFVFSYDDLKDGETDFDLEKFDLGQDKKDVIPVLQEILKISPDIKILASPWSAPVWMKTNSKVKGGGLKPECYEVYSQYFVKYIQQMKKEGIDIDAITTQNEPINSNNTPSLRMSAGEQAEFIRNNLGPAFGRAGINTKIVLFDHNLDRPDFPLTILNDPEAAKYVNGSGFHHYGGDMSAMSLLHAAYPDKNLYFTEQMVTERPGSTTSDVASQVKRLIIGTTTNWSKNTILWNLAADPLNDPHTDDGGCSMCQGAVTISGDSVTRNIAYYVVAHASKFVTPGSVRISSTQKGNISVSLSPDEEKKDVLRVSTFQNNEALPNVAFRTPEGKIVLIVADDSWDVSSFRIQYRSHTATIKLNPGSVGTYIWLANGQHKTLIPTSGKFKSKVFGENVLVFEPGMDMKEIQTLIDTIYKNQSGRGSEFSKNRYALLFKPGRYNLDIRLGYYMQVLGLGESPDDVVIVGAVRSLTRGNSVLTNFWRGAENLTIIPTSTDSVNIWGVSQASPLRRIHIKGNLNLFDKGYASGGFLADSKIDGTINSGPQQQWFSRNVDMGKWVGSNWNMMFVGVPNAPSGVWPAKPYTVIDKTPVIREKPYLVSVGDGFGIKFPILKKQTVGTTWADNVNDEKTLKFSSFYIVTEGKDNSESINAALKTGKNLLFMPGIYSLDKSLDITRKGTVIIGIGMPSLVPLNGNAVITISDVDGVTVSGLLVDAGTTYSKTLFQVGEPNSLKSHEADPTFLFDVFIRVGGPAEGSAECAVLINSKNVCIDHIWLWRADHGNGVGWDKNKGANGLIVNGDNVTVYGLFNEHFQQYQTLWNGNGGRVYFYQSEMPYDPPTADAWKHDGINGYASYKVADKVTSHEAWGLGIYNVFYDAPVIVDNAIETPVALEKNIHHTIIFWLNGNKESVVRSIINGKGGSIGVSNRKATMD